MAWPGAKGPHLRRGNTALPARLRSSEGLIRGAVAVRRRWQKAAKKATPAASTPAPQAAPAGTGPHASRDDLTRLTTAEGIVVMSKIKATG